MLARFLNISLVFLLFAVPLRAQSVAIISPDAFLPHGLGSRFTPHHLLVDYFQYADAVSDKMQLVQYGQTYELRPLIAAVISSPENMKRIEEIRRNNLRRAGMLEGTASEEDIAIVWLSYSVHGDEAAGAESSMAVLYDLLKGGEPYDSWLKNTVVIIDPSLNPDGYSRFSQWSNSVSAAPNNPNPDAREHTEPWPGGRTNHYYFDLNRDWVWQSQQESRDRVAFYLKWMPHVHADLHEMGAESPYYFAPAAQPYHQNITTWQAAFQSEIGKNHAAHFDKEGWRYYTRERFDLFYPSYGDTYPMFAGAIGMTYEQGGGGGANRAVLLSNGDTLTLYDRIAHHRAASLSTIEVSSTNASRLVEEFATYFKRSVSDPPGEVNSYVIKASNNQDRIADFLLLLRRQGIRYGLATTDHKAIRGLSYLTGDQEVFDLQKGDLIIPASQPRAVLANVLFQPGSILADSLTYDITAWCVPMAYGLEGYATETLITHSASEVLPAAGVSGNEPPFAYALQWGSVPAAKALAALVARGIVSRFAKSPFRVGGVEYPEGTVMLMKADNRKNPFFDQGVKEIASAFGTTFSLIPTGLTASGNDLGSDAYKLVRRPEILVVSGEDVRPTSLGEIWHFFEEEMKYPIHMEDVEDLTDTGFEHYNVIILPEGYYSLSGNMISKLNDWVTSGGRLIAIGSAINKLAGKKGFEITLKTSTSPDSIHQIARVPESLGGMERKSISAEIPGTIFQTTIDQTHPLSFGLGDAYWSLKTAGSNFEWLGNGGNAVYLDDTPRYYGFAGYKALEKTKNTLIAGQEDIGAGSVVYLVDNPLFRSFWNSGKVLFSNALFF